MALLSLSALQFISETTGKHLALVFDFSIDFCAEPHPMVNNDAVINNKILFMVNPFCE
jgi:hypothetical protein